MSSRWAESADEPSALTGNDSFSAERIIAQSPDGRTVTKEITEFKTLEDGSRVKVTRKVTCVRKMVRLNKSVKARRSWAKFGDCDGQAPGFKENGVVNIAEKANFELAGQEESETVGNKGMGSLLNMDTFAVLRQLRTKMASGDITQEQYDAERARILNKKAPTPGAGGTEGAEGEEKKEGPAGYVPPHMRNKEGGDNQNEPENATLRVTNVSQDATRDDLMDIFRHCGPIARISVPTDRETGYGRGFAFVDFYNRKDAAAAIEKIHGTGFDSLILSVDWARPSAGGGGGGGGGEGGRGGGGGGGVGGGGGGGREERGGFGDRDGGGRRGGFGDRDRDREGGGFRGGRSMADSNTERFRSEPSRADAGPWRR